MFLWIHTPSKPAPKPRQNRPFEELEAERKPRPNKLSMGKGKWRLHPLLAAILMAAGLFVLLAVVNRYHQEVTLSEVKVNFLAVEDNAFLTSNEVKEAMGWEGGHAPIGERLDQLQLSQLEEQLLSSPYVRSAELHKSLTGVLHVDVRLRKPVGRIMNNSGADVYLDAEGKKFPITPQHSANVVLVRGDFEEAVADTFACETISATLPLLNFIASDPYWNHYFSELVIDELGEVTLYPREESLPIEFGYPFAITDKLQRLRIFREQVLEHPERPRLRSINLKYEGQIVAKQR